MLSHLRPAISVLVLLTLVTGIVYPVTVTALAQIIFPDQANGSLIIRDGQAIGSELIGQSFGDPKYFWGRLSATAPFPYNAAASSGSNFGPLHPSLIESAKTRIDQLSSSGSANGKRIPVDLVTASASGLDPHISLAAAEFQIPRIAQSRGLEPTEVRKLVEFHLQTPTLGLWGEVRVHVLRLNLALDELQSRNR